MKVKSIVRSEAAVDRCDWRQAYEVHVDGKLKASFRDGEPEDSNLCRDFSDVYSIPKLMQMAYDAGKNGEEFAIEDIESDDI